MVWPGKGSRRASAQAKSLPQTFALTLLSLKLKRGPPTNPTAPIAMPIGPANFASITLPKAKTDENAPVTARRAALPILLTSEDSHL